MDAAGTSERRALPWLIKLSLGIGFGLLALALMLVVARWRFLSSATRAPAKVTAVATEPMRDGNGAYEGVGYRVFVTFRDENGRGIILRSPVASSTTALRVGDRVSVDYPPGRPEKAVIARFVDRWLLPLVIGTIGAVWAAIAGLATWMWARPGTRVYGGGAGRLRMAIRSPRPADTKRP